MQQNQYAGKVFIVVKQLIKLNKNSITPAEIDSDCLRAAWNMRKQIVMFPPRLLLHALNLIAKAPVDPTKRSLFLGREIGINIQRLILIILPNRWNQVLEPTHYYQLTNFKQDQVDFRLLHISLVRGKSLTPH